MTEQEAEAFVATLKRIWGCYSEAEVDWRLRDDGFFAHLPIQSGVTLLIYPNLWALKRGDQPGFILQSLIFDFDTASIYWTKKDETFAPFADRWLPIFRRNCWLSGCNIEASAHEKAGWMQGFSREELQAWNLKM